MPHTLDQILPSLEAFGTLGYWVIGLASGLEAFFLAGVVVPGTLIVDAGGILVQRGLLDFFDLVWFVAIGSVLGSELGFWTGRLALARLPGRRRIEDSRAFARAQALFERRGGLALVLGRFLGPVAGLVSLAAAMAGMDHRKFLMWNAISSIPYAIAHLTIGYLLGDAMGRIGGALTNAASVAVILVLLLAVLWGLLYSALRLLPLALTVLSAAMGSLAEQPRVRHWSEAHPRSVAWIAARFDRTAFVGLPLTGLALFFFYVGGLWLDSAFEFLTGDPILKFDTRLAELIHHFQAPGPIRLAAFVTATANWQAVLPLAAACLVWLALERRRGLAVGLLVSVLGSTLSVVALKLVFNRARSPLGNFLETSNSFPSGHAAASVGFWGMLMYVLWRAGRLRAETALLAAGLAAFAIGSSRVYLLEHYLTDVLNGWLVGALWLIVGVALAEWLTDRRSPARAPVTGAWRMAGLAAVVALVGLAAVDVWRLGQPRTPPVVTADRVLSDPQALATAADFPATTETLLGSPMRPISVIVLARDTETLRTILIGAGWTALTPPSAGMIFDALWSALAGREDPTAETISHFWRGQPSDLALVAPTGAKGHVPHARFWASDYVTKGGLRVFAGSVGIDEAGAQAATDMAAHEALLTALGVAGATHDASVVLGTGPVPVLRLP